MQEEGKMMENLHRQIVKHANGTEQTSSSITQMGLKIKKEFQLNQLKQKIF